MTLCMIGSPFVRAEVLVLMFPNGLRQAQRYYTTARSPAQGGSRLRGVAFSDRGISPGIQVGFASRILSENRCKGKQWCYNVIYGEDTRPAGR